jgi:cytochrome d ubiquinol oxidase subunit I
MWHTEPAPAPLTLFGIPDQQARETRYRIQVPWALGLLATRSISQPVPGIFDLVDDAKARIRRGLDAYGAVQTLRRDPQDAGARAALDKSQGDLGYAMLLRRYVDDPAKATDAQIEQAAWATVPDVATLFWAFRIMVGLGFYFIALFTTMFYVAARRQLDRRRWLLRLAFYSLPLPWIAAEVGWVVAEYGRQPWIIEGVLPTFLAASPVPVSNVWISLSGFVLFYTVLLVVDLYLMIKYARLGPSETWEVPDFAARKVPPGGVLVDRATLHPRPRPAE